MALPKLTTPTYELELPSTDEKIKYRPFLVKEEKILMMAMESKASADITQAVKDIVLECTFNKVDTGVQSRNNSQSLVIESCTFANFINTGARFLRYRGGDGNNNVANGIQIRNSIFGHSWDQSGEGVYGIQGVGEGLESTNFELLNIYSTSNFSFNEGKEIPGFPVGNYSGTQDDLWKDVDNNDFNFKDTGSA